MGEELALIVAAYLSGLAASSLRLPPLVGYLGAGYLLYYFGVRPGETLDRLSAFGIEFLLFTVGLKLQLKSLFRGEVLLTGGLHMVVVTGITMLGFLLLGGQLGGGMLILQDIVAVGLLALAGGARPTPWALLLLLLPLLRPLIFRWFDSHGGDELRLLFGITLTLGSGAIANAVGVSPELSALWLGALLAGHADAKALSDNLWGLKEAFLVAFFLQIGMSGLPSEDDWLTALQLVAALPVQGIVFFSLLILVGLRARTAFVTSLALATYSEKA